MIQEDAQACLENWVDILVQRKVTHSLVQMVVGIQRQVPLENGKSLCGSQRSMSHLVSSETFDSLYAVQLGTSRSHVQNTVLVDALMAHNNDLEDSSKPAWALALKSKP